MQAFGRVIITARVVFLSRLSKHAFDEAAAISSAQRPLFGSAARVLLQTIAGVCSRTSATARDALAPETHCAGNGPVIGIDY